MYFNILCFKMLIATYWNDFGAHSRKGKHTFSIKGQTVSVSDFVSHVASVRYTQDCPGGRNAETISTAVLQ